MNQPVLGAGVSPRGSPLRPLWVSLAIFGVSLALLWLGDRWLAERAETRGALPVLSGSLRVSGLSQPVEILRDARGIPHLRAASPSDAWQALGFVHAQDRLGQMLWLRRLARGRAAEVAGPAALAGDRLARTLGIGRAADAEAAQLAPAVRKVLAAYARGVNARIARIEAGLAGPPRFTADWPPPQAWRPADSIALVKLLSWGTGTSMDTGLVLSDLVERLGGLGARLFFPVPGAIAGVGGTAARTDYASGRGGGTAGWDPGAARGLGVLALRGSAWVVDGRLTASGAPLLGAELSFAPTAPPLLYAAVLGGGKLLCAGVTLPGVPAFWAGRNRDVAWAVAPARAADVDWHLETLHPDDPSRYHSGGRWMPVEERVETIAVRGPDGGRREEPLRVRSTRHGPLLNELLGAGREPLALAWTGAVPGEGVAGLLGVAAARDAAELRAALRHHHEPALVFAYVDRHGAGGLQTAGWLPRRVLPTSLLPVPGRMLAFDWREPVAFELLPQDRFARGSVWLIASDAAIDGEGPPAPIEWVWRGGRRARRLHWLLTERASGGAIDAAALLNMSADQAVPAALELLPPLLAAALHGPPLGPRQREITALLAAWDGDAPPSSRGAAAYHVFLDGLVRELFSERVGDALLARYLALAFTSPESILAGVVRGAVGNPRAGSASAPDRLGPAVRAALLQTWTELRARLGPNRERWRWGRLHPLHFRLFHTAPGAGAALAGLPRATPLGGGSESLFAASLAAPFGDDREPYGVGRSSLFRMAVDLGDASRSWQMLAPGQSEHPVSAHFADGFEPWLGQRAEPVELDPARAAANAQNLLRLEPGP